MNINYKQLAFVLDITPLEAFEKMIAIHSKVTGRPLPEVEEKVTKYDSIWPREMSVSSLSEHLNVPDLEYAIHDIKQGFLKRPSSRKWILCDYPEKKLETTPKHKIKIPPVLASLLPDESIATIKQEWNKRFGIPVK